MRNNPHLQVGNLLHHLHTDLEDKQQVIWQSSVPRFHYSIWDRFDGNSAAEIKRSFSQAFFESYVADCFPSISTQSPVGLGSCGTAFSYSRSVPPWGGKFLSGCCPARCCHFLAYVRNCKVPVLLFLGGRHLISRGGRGQGFGDGPKYFFYYDPADTYFFSSCLVVKVFILLSLWNFFNYILKAIIYFNSWQLQLSILPSSCLKLFISKVSLPRPLQIKWWPRPIT